MYSLLADLFQLHFCFGLVSCFKCAVRSVTPILLRCSEGETFPLPSLRSRRRVPPMPPTIATARRAFGYMLHARPQPCPYCKRRVCGSRVPSSVAPLGCCMFCAVCCCRAVSLRHPPALQLLSMCVGAYPTLAQPHERSRAHSFHLHVLCAHDITIMPSPS